MLKYILSAVIAYLLGSISIAIVVSRIKLGGDVREHGSGNAGATNVARVYGMKAGLMTLFGDMAKTAVSGLIGWLLAGENGLAIACFFCLAGHCWPVYFGFKGGKGVSVAACIALLFDWRFLLILLAVFFLMFLISRRVSLCSVSCAVVYPFAYYFLERSFDLGFFVCLLIAVIVIWLHRGNIRRLLKGEEAQFKPKSK